MENNVQPKIVTKPGFKVVGISIISNDLLPREYINWDYIWHDFRSKLQEIKHRISDDVTWGVSYCGLRDENDPYTMIKYPDNIYIAAVEVDSFEDLPELMTKKEISENLYAVFTCKGKDKNDSMQKIGEIVSYAYFNWLPLSGYTRDKNGMDLENNDRNLIEVDYYMPIKKTEN